MAEEDDFEQASYNINYGPSKDKMFYILAFYVCVLALGIFFLLWKLRGYNRPELTFDQIMARHGAATEKGPQLEKQPRQEEAPRRRRNIQARIQKSIETIGRQEQNGDEDISEGQEEDFIEDEVKKPTEKIGAKKLKKLQEKEERREFREAMEMERVERKKRQEEGEKTRNIEEEKQTELEKLKEEEEQKVREQKEKEEHELYLEMKKAFEVNEEGQNTFEDEEQLQNQLGKFISYLKEKKVVLLEDLASHFGLRTKDAIERVQDLLKEETITGVIDDRGKFIYISNEELQSVAKFVKQRSRVAISEIAAASNRLINLNQESEVTGFATEMKE